MNQRVVCQSLNVRSDMAQYRYLSKYCVVKVFVLKQPEKRSTIYDDCKDMR